MHVPFSRFAHRFAPHFCSSRRRQMLRAVALLGLGVLVAPAAGTAQVVYNNLVNTIVGSQANGGATSLSPADNTKLLADDITFAAGFANRQVNAFTLAVGNAATTATTAQLTIQFFDRTGANGGPGTLLATVTRVATFASGVGNQTFSGTNLFAIPANGQIWAGFYFTGVTGTSSVAALNQLGAATEDPPATGSSSNTTAFVSTAQATGGSNPPGTIGLIPNAGQPSNFGMSFAVPEPSSVALTALAGTGLLGLGLRRRRGAV